MAIIARASITLSTIRDISSTTWYYKLQASTASPPAKPTTNPPGNNWVTTEPSYTTGSTNSLYTTELTIFTDGTFSYSDVSLSSSYEAAKAAYNEANNAKKVATNYLQDVTNDGVFVHEASSTPVTPTTPGANGVHISDDVDIIRDGEVVASYGEDVTIGKEFDDEAYSQVKIAKRGFKLIYKATPSGSSNEICNIGFSSEVTFNEDITQTQIVNSSVTVNNPIVANTLTILAMYYDPQTHGMAGNQMPASNYSVSGNVITFNSLSFLNPTSYGSFHHLDVTYVGTPTDPYLRFGPPFTPAYAPGSYSTAFGYRADASGEYATAEGFAPTSRGDHAHAEGTSTIANGHSAHAEGSNARAYGSGAHAEGYYSEASGAYSHAQNEYNRSTKKAQTVLGTYNDYEGDSTTTTHPSGNTDYGKYALMIGNGTDSSHRSNALTVDWTGVVQGAKLSHVGMIIHSTTLDTMAKVIAEYGGTTWIQHSGYMLYGATSNVVANSAVKTGGEASHTLTVDEMPSHTHPNPSGGAYLINLTGTGMSFAAGSYSRTTATATGARGGGQAHNNMPPYKNVYIWERTA